jgi:hypothetical protein
MDVPSVVCSQATVESCDPVNLGTVAVAGTVTVVSGLADAYGFVHASRMWDEGHLVAFEWARSGIGFAAGIPRPSITSKQQVS